MANFFDGANNFNVDKLKVDNVGGNYTDERNTFIDTEEVGQATYHQEGAVGVVNGRGRFRGKINHAGGPPTSKKSKSGPTRSQTAPGAYSAREPTNHSYQPNLDREYTSRSPRSDKSNSDASFFKNARDFDVDNMDIQNTTGDRVDRGTTRVHSQYTHEKVYNQKGAVGVVNDQGRMTATINYGGKSKASKASKHQSDSSDEESESEEDSSSDDDYNQDHARGSKYNQKGAVGVVNDRGRFKGTINYNTPHKDKRNRAKRRQRDEEYAYDNHAEVPSATPSNGQREYRYETPPSIGVQPSSPPQGPIQDTGRMHGHGGPFQQQSSPWTPRLGPLPENRYPYQEPRAHPHYQQQAPPNMPLSPLNFGLQTPPPTPGYPMQHGTPQRHGGFGQPNQVEDRNPFRRMTVQSGYDLNTITSQMDKMHMYAQGAYASPPPTGYGGSPGAAPQYF